MMDLMRAIESRHSVRQFTDEPITGEAAEELRSFVEECNRESGLNMQLILGDTQGFSGVLRRVILKNALNYLAIVGKDDETLAGQGGYYGEKVVLRATQMGIASCWFAMGARKGRVRVVSGEKMLIVVALGYPATEGKPHTSKPLEELYTMEDDAITEAPGWFLAGVRAAQLAPTARNQQKFRFTLSADGQVKVESLGGMLSDIDLGIVRCHFEVGAGHDSFTWI
jgi:nitroreductase